MKCKCGHERGDHIYPDAQCGRTVRPSHASCSCRKFESAEAMHSGMGASWYSSEQVDKMIAASEARVLAKVAATFRSIASNERNMGPNPLHLILSLEADRLDPQAEPLKAMTLDAALAEIKKLKDVIAQKAESNRNMSDLLGRLQREVNEARVAMQFMRRMEDR